ncbi:MAG: hypothetical protein GWO81_02295 [Verrucomicrobia bacterium]|nr:hypothetical protein [Verrucomicrobiota bacterium]
MEKLAAETARDSGVDPAGVHRLRFIAGPTTVVQDAQQTLTRVVYKLEGSSDELIWTERNEQVIVTPPQPPSASQVFYRLKITNQ